MAGVSRAYRYFGLVFGRMTVDVSLDSATLPDPGDHAAVWAGVNSPRNAHWVQAGIEAENGAAAPSLYVEVGLDGRQVQLVRWPFRYGATARVRLRRGVGFWTASVRPLDGGQGGGSSAPVRVPHPIADATLETFGGRVSAVGWIAGRRVTAETGARWKRPRP